MASCSLKEDHDSFTNRENSYETVAQCQACVDACLKQQPIPGSRLDEMPHVCEDHFINSQPATDWRSQLSHAEKIGLGVREYEIINL